MDRHELKLLECKVGELLRFGSRSCIDQAHSLMTEKFRSVLYFALELTEPKPKAEHTIADHYPAGGLTASEPCAFCQDYEQLEAERDTANKALEKIMAFVAGDNDGDNIPAILNIAEQVLKGGG